MKKAAGICKKLVFSVFFGETALDIGAPENIQVFANKTDVYACIFTKTI